MYDSMRRPALNLHPHLSDPSSGRRAGRACASLGGSTCVPAVEGPCVWDMLMGFNVSINIFIYRYVSKKITKYICIYIYIFKNVYV